MTHSFNNIARMYIGTLNGDLCAMTSDMHFPHPHAHNLRRLHRTVVLPDFQGLGIAILMQEFVCSRNKKNGYRTSFTTSNPAMINACKNSNKWKCTFFGRHGKGSENGIFQNKHKKGSTSANRITASFEYIGD